MSQFILEDDDGTEVSISNNEEVKFIGSGITTNWTDTTPGSDGDPFDLTFTVDAAQTGITSILATDLKIGEDDQTKIDFETADEIHFYAANAHEITLAANEFSPNTSDGIALGTGSKMWSDLFLASGAVVNFNNGDITLTHSSNTLTAAGGTVATAALTTSTIVASGIVKTDDATDATSTTDGSLQTDGGLSVAKDAVVGNDLLMLSDAAVVHFGTNKDVTLTHVADVGLTITHIGTGDNLPVVLQLKSEENAVVADEVIASIEFAAGDSDGTDGATVAAGIHAIAEETFAADANATSLVFTAADSETAAASATAKMTLASTGNLTVVGTLTCATSLTIGSAVMAEADLEKLDGITNGTAAAAKAVVLDASKNIATIGTLGCAAITSTGNSAMAQLTTSGRVIVDDTTAATSTTDGSLQTDGGLSVALDAVVGDDLILLSDASVVHFGTNSEITLTHEHDVGLILEGNGVSACPVLTLKNTNNDATGGTLKFLKDGGNVADNDVVGNITFVSEDDGDNAHTFASIVATIPDMTGGAEEGKLTLNVASHDGEIQPGLIVASGDAEDEVDVTIGNGTASIATVAGSLSVTHNVNIDSSPADESCSGITAIFTAGEDLSRGEVVYFKAGDSKMWKAVATAAATTRCVAMAAADISADAAGLFLLEGFLTDNGTFPAYTITGVLYTPEAETSSENVPEQTAPDTDGDFVQVIGWAVTANTVYFRPDSTVIEVA